MHRRINAKLYDQLRRSPVDGLSVTGSLPVLFFGDLFRAVVATVGINPSWQEFLDHDREELAGQKRRFQTLTSLGAASRATLTNDQADRAIEAMRGYFDGNVYSWFAGYARVVDGMGASYDRGTAVHLDLVQEATDPTWSILRRNAPARASALLDKDLPFLKWQVEAFPLKAVVCGSKVVGHYLCKAFGVTEVARSGDTGKRRWWATAASIAGRTVGLAGWNVPLARPPGLTKDEQRVLGVTIASALADLGVDW